MRARTGEKVRVSMPNQGCLQLPLLCFSLGIFANKSPERDLLFIFVVAFGQFYCKLLFTILNDDGLSFVFAFCAIKRTSEMFGHPLSQIERSSIYCFFLLLLVVVLQKQMRS